MQVPFSPPSITDLEIDEVLDTLRSGWITTGPKARQFESEFSHRVQSPAALAVNSCTAALAIALKLHGIGPGDEVITSTLTFVSTVNVIEHTGATPVLVDVEPDTLNIDPSAIREAITPRTRAVIAVHFAGQPVELDQIRAICDENGLALIEDAAHAMPAAFDGQPIGGGANLTAFSFYATKNLTTGEGGMLTGPSEMIERARSLSLHGMSRNAWNRYGKNGQWHYSIEEPGYKCNMSDLQAAIGLAQLHRLDDLQARRKCIFDRYDDAFHRWSEFETPVRRARRDHALHLYVLRLQGRLAGGRDRLIDELRDAGITTSVHFIPVHRHNFYETRYRHQPQDFPVANDSFGRMLSLPLSPALSDDQIEWVIERVMAFAQGAVRKSA